MLHYEEFNEHSQSKEILNGLVKSFAGNRLVHSATNFLLFTANCTQNPMLVVSSPQNLMWLEQTTTIIEPKEVVAVFSTINAILVNPFDNYS